MKVSAAIAGGLAGTLTVATIHETLKRLTPDAPRMDTLDVELLRKGLEFINVNVPEQNLQRMAIAGELICDSAYYSLAGIGSRKGVWLRGTLLGLVAGMTAVVLPKPLGLPEEPSNKNRRTQLMTVGLYLIGGVVAAATSQYVNSSQKKNKVQELLM